LQVLLPMYKRLMLLAICLMSIALVLFSGELSLPLLFAVLGCLTAVLLIQLEWVAYALLGLMASLFFSIEIPLFGGTAISLPAEPLAIVLAACAVLLAYRNKSDVRILVEQPLAFAMLLLVASWAFSALASTMPLVSIKYVFINLVYMAVGLLLVPLLVKTQRLSIPLLLTVLIPALAFFALFAVINLMPYRFNPGAASLIGLPFFKDHTVFSATMSLFLPLLLLWGTYTKRAGYMKWLPTAIGVLVLFALFISSSRAAWLAVLIAAGFFIFVRNGGQLRHLGLVLILAVGVTLFFVDDIEHSFRTNPHKSTEISGSLQDQVLSVTNINSDVSNRERINRWKCAIRMGVDRPWVGFGPGTYQFQYFPYQRDHDMTYISVTHPFNTVAGRGGSAHSEYLLLLSESGFPGLLAWIALQFVLLVTFFKIWNGNLGRHHKNAALAIYLGILTFTIHSLFNNYLNTVQFGVSWWTLVGVMLYYGYKNKALENRT
jgi:putative inorganic carbon (HCO3(-)) transporter